MAVHAHPDDESSKGAASMLRYVREGAEVMVVTCTDGRRGDILNPAMKDDPRPLADMVAWREREMAAAAEILGVKHAWLGFEDSGLPEGDPPPPLPEGSFATLPLEVAAEPLVRLVREFRPHVITTYDENGGYPHPDHIRTHEVSVLAYDAAADPAAYPDAGEPWRTSKLYYHVSFSRPRLRAMHDAAVEAGIDSPFADRIAQWAEEVDPHDRTTARIECADWFEERDRALIAHASQVDPTGFWFSIPIEVQRRSWPTEDYELVRSEVETDEFEDDLFAGLRHEEPAREVNAS
jgi:mycothiol S-conjugate amidase